MSVEYPVHKYYFARNVNHFKKMEHAATSMLNNFNSKILARKISEMNKSLKSLFGDSSFQTERVCIEMLFSDCCWNKDNPDQCG